MHKTINIIYYQDKQTVDDMSGLVVALLIPLSYSDNYALFKVDTSALLVTCITHHMHYSSHALHSQLYIPYCW